MHIMNNYNALYHLITLCNAFYIKALSKVLPRECWLQNKERKKKEERRKKEEKKKKIYYY